MSLGSYYLRRTMQDLANRIDKVLLNGNEIEIINITVDNQFLVVETERVDGIDRINNVKLLDELDNVIIERNPNRNTEGSRSLEFRFEIEVE